MRPEHAGHAKRNAELAAIHVAKKQLGLDDDTYRDMLFTIARVRSAADLDHAGRQAVIEHLRKRGFTKASSDPRPAPVDHGKKPAVSADKQPLIDKLEALLASGAKHWNYVRAIALRRFGLQLEWCSADQLRRLVAMLEYDRQRRVRKAKGDGR